jgi:hypothetical protein
VEYATRLIEPPEGRADASFEVTLAIAAATRTARTTPIVLIRTIKPPY